MSRREFAEIVINADAATIFDVLADPSQHALFDGSDSVKGKTAGPPRLYLGAKFSMRMRIGAPYLTRNLCVEYDEDRLIAWRHFARHVWRYELEPVGTNGRQTKVTESFDYAPAPAAGVYERIGIPDRNRKAIEVTLQQLKVLVESRSSIAS
jgi:Polyketide cyclase / dehydrase and lipid transport